MTALMPLRLMIRCSEFTQCVQRFSPSSFMVIHKPPPLGVTMAQSVWSQRKVVDEFGLPTFFASKGATDESVETQCALNPPREQ